MEQKNYEDDEVDPLLAEVVELEIGFRTEEIEKAVGKAVSEMWLHGARSVNVEANIDLLDDETPSGEIDIWLCLTDLPHIAEFSLEDILLEAADIEGIENEVLAKALELMASRIRKRQSDQS